jgi:hypothetical protein
LDSPAVPIRVTEGGKLHPARVLDLTDIGATAQELGARSARSDTTSCSPSRLPGVIPVIPIPITIEAAEPGGVSCTTLRHKWGRQPL